MADDYEIKNDEKAVLDLINNYRKEKLINRKKEIINSLNDEKLSSQELASLEKELQDLIIELAKIK